MNLKKTAPLLLCFLLTACGSPEESVTGYVEKAQKLFESEDYVSAKLEASNALQIDPKNAEARLLLAKIELQKSGIRSALMHLMIAIETDPGMLDAQLLLGTMYFLAGQRNKVAEQANTVMELAPGDARSRLLSARSKYMLKEFDAAQEELEVALQIEPKLTDAILLRAVIHAEQNDIDAALAGLNWEQYELDALEAMRLRNFRIVLLQENGRLDDAEAELISLVEDFPESDQFLGTLVKVYIDKGQIDEAESSLRKLTRLDPDDINRQLMLVQFLSEKRSPELAEEALKGFVEEWPESTPIRLALGNFYESAGKLDEAAAVYNEIIEMSPTSQDGLKARNRLVSINVREKNPDEARGMISEILVDDSANIDALMGRAVFLFVEKKYLEVIADTRVVTRRDPENEEALVLMGRAFEELGDKVLAEDAYRRVLDINAYNTDAATQLSAILISQNKADEAEALLRQILKMQSKETKASTALISTLVAKDDFEAAEAEARRMIELDESSSLGYYQLGVVLQRWQKAESAIDNYRKALELDPGADFALNNLVVLLIQLNRADEAINEAEGNLAQNPDDPAVKSILANAYYGASQLKKAEQIIEELIAGAPASAGNYIRLASFYEAGNEDRLNAFKRGIAANPGDKLLTLYLGTEYEKLGRYEDAIKMYEDAIANNPNEDLFANNLAMLLLDHRSDKTSHAAALELAKRFADKRDPGFADTLGWAYYRNGDFLNATQNLEFAVATVSQVAQLRYHLGMAYLATGNLVGARSELGKAIELTGDNNFQGIDEARTALAKLEKES